MKNVLNTQADRSVPESDGSFPSTAVAIPFARPAVRTMQLVAEHVKAAETDGGPGAAGRERGGEVGETSDAPTAAASPTAFSPVGRADGASSLRSLRLGQLPGL